MSRLSLEAREAAAFVARLCGGTLELKDNGFRLNAPAADLKLDARRFEFEGTVEKGFLKADVLRIQIRETDIEIEFSL